MNSKSSQSVAFSQFQCGSCFQILRVADLDLGKEIACPQCGYVFLATRSAAYRRAKQKDTLDLLKWARWEKPDPPNEEDLIQIAHLTSRAKQSVYSDLKAVLIPISKTARKQISDEHRGDHTFVVEASVDYQNMCRDKMEKPLSKLMSNYKLNWNQIHTIWSERRRWRNAKAKFIGASVAFLVIGGGIAGVVFEESKNAKDSAHVSVLRDPIEAFRAEDISWSVSKSGLSVTGSAWKHDRKVELKSFSLRFPDGSFCNPSSGQIRVYSKSYSVTFSEIPEKWKRIIESCDAQQIARLGIRFRLFDESDAPIVIENGRF